LVGRVVNRVNAFEEWFVLRDLIIEARQLRGHLALHHLKVGARHRAGPNPVYGGDPIQSTAGLLQRDDRVVEGGRRANARDVIDLGKVLSHGRFQRRLEHRDLNFIERRHAPVRAFPFREQQDWIRRNDRASSSSCWVNRVVRKHKESERAGEKERQTASNEFAHSETSSFDLKLPKRRLRRRRDWIQPCKYIERRESLYSEDSGPN